MARALFLLPLLLFAVLAGYFFTALRPAHDVRELPSAMIEKPAPSFDLAGLGDRQAADAGWAEGAAGRHQLLRLLVRPVPHRASAADAPGAENHVPIYGIAYKDKPEASLEAAEHLRRSVSPRSGLDQDGRTGLNFGVYGVPETYVIDSNGIIRKRFVGPLTAEAVDKELLPLLKKLGAS